MKEQFNWNGIDWRNEQDVLIQRRVQKLKADGSSVMKRGKFVRPTRERVRQKRMEEYLKALRAALALPEREGEQDVRATITWALSRSGGQQVAILKTIGEMELSLESPLRDAIADANSIYRPVGWHGRDGTTKAAIKVLETDGMTVKEIATRVGCGVSYVSQALKDLGKGYKVAPRGKELYKWSRFFRFSDTEFVYDRNGKRYPKVMGGVWQDMTDGEIASKLGVKNEMVVTQYRNRHLIKRRESEVAVDV